jgi:hypothetical protein
VWGVGCGVSGVRFRVLGSGSRAWIQKLSG